MTRIKIYTTMLCPSRHVAKQLLEKKDAVVEEIDVSFQPQKRAKMSSLAGGRSSVPQIWIGDRHIGGCNKLLDAVNWMRCGQSLLGNGPCGRWPFCPIHPKLRMLSV